jgi:GNAT superfamily N-acetyltransferase
VTVDFSFLTEQQIHVFLEQIVGVYREAFRVPPYSKQEEEVLDFAESLPAHMRREGFQFVAATGEASEHIVGIAYGYQSVPGQFWYENVRKAMPEQVASDWLTQSFQLVEIVVAPVAQGQGIGGRLHDQLLAGVPYERAVLSTVRAQTVAHWMYRKRGWRVLVEDMRFPRVNRPYQIMGLDLTMLRSGNTVFRGCDGVVIPR